MSAGGPVAAVGAPVAGRGPRPGRGAPWLILTGEYPPQPGGVSDYTHLVASGLASGGAEVHVWCPPAPGPSPETGGVTVHRDAGRWSRDDLRRVSEAIDAFNPPRRLLVQYTPNAWGFRGANLGFGRWLVGRRRRGDEVWTMVHEAFVPWRLRDRPSRWALAVAQRALARSVLAASARVYYSMPYWEPLLRAHEPGPSRRPMAWLPVPGNVPVVADPAGVAALRRRLAPGGGPIVGNFGTYGPDLRGLLGAVLPPLLAGGPGRVGLLIGRNGPALAADLIASHPGLGGRLVATGGLPPAGVSLHLQACDLLVQPYEYGVSTRRGTVMAGMEHARAIATTAGMVTEPFWSASSCVALAPAGDGPALVQLANDLLGDPGARDRLGASARAVYRDRFAVERTVGALLADAEARDG